MILGDQASFAIETIVEPGPDFPPVVGMNIVGRFRMYFGGLELGDFSEPSCVLKTISEHLVSKCAVAHTLWHESLSGKAPEEWFKMLNHALYVSGVSEPPEAYHRMDFLTNVSEALNNVKGFLVVPPDEPIHALIQLPHAVAVHHRTIPHSAFCSVATQFATWVNDRERDLLHRIA